MHVEMGERERVQSLGDKTHSGGIQASVVSQIIQTAEGWLRVEVQQGSHVPFSNKGAFSTLSPSLPFLCPSLYPPHW